MDVRADPARTRTPCLVCFFLVIRRPPRSTLFPTRRSSDPRIASLLMMAGLLGLYIEFTHPGLRSEEHTSELQSLTNLVCRLLLEKKKTSHRRSSSGSAADIG